MFSPVLASGVELQQRVHGQYYTNTTTILSNPMGASLCLQLRKTVIVCCFFELHANEKDFARVPSTPEMGIEPMTLRLLRPKLQSNPRTLPTELLRLPFDSVLDFTRGLNLPLTGTYLNNRINRTESSLLELILGLPRASTSLSKKLVFCPSSCAPTM